MYHKDGISVHLEAWGKDIEEFAYPNGQDPADTEWNNTRAIISAKLHTPFTIVLELTKNFRPFSAGALKLTVAIGHSHQTPEDLVDVQAWHVPLDQISKNKFKISEQWAEAEKTIQPIRWEWFQELRSNGKSNNGMPYVFKFRNVGTYSEICELVSPVAELEARNRADEIQQDIDFETEFGGFTGE